MQTENKLNITAGEWTPQSSTFGENVRVNNKTIATCYRKVDNEQEAEANAILIADAGATANICGLLPSELLKQRDRLIHALELLCATKGEGIDAEIKAYDKAKEVLHSTRT